MTKLLIIEDHMEIVELLDDLLSDEGYELVFAHNRADAVTLAEEELPHLILADLKIPESGEDPTVSDIGGLEATRAIKANPKTAHIPVVAATAHVMIHDRERILDAGCDDIEKKPYDFDSLIDTIERNHAGKKEGER